MISQFNAALFLRLSIKVFLFLGALLTGVRKKMIKQIPKQRDLIGVQSLSNGRTQQLRCRIPLRMPHLSATEKITLA